MQEYPATYTDAHGSEKTVITNDGKTLRMVVRGVEFSGNCFQSWRPAEGTSLEQLKFLSIDEIGMLCSCRIDCSLKLPIQARGERKEGELHITSILEPVENSDWEYLFPTKLTLVFEGNRYEGGSNSGWFEDELNLIQRKLSDGVFFLACINCQFSDYSPYGSGTFGDLMCFRNVKSEYLGAGGKAGLLWLESRKDRFVQEIYLCSEFERRVPGTGYRG